jgi:hypothetical protein
MHERRSSAVETAAHLGVRPEPIDHRIAREGTLAHRLARRWNSTASEVVRSAKDGLARHDDAISTGGASARSKHQRP